MHKNKLRDPQSGALIYTVVRWSVMHLQEYDHVINPANQAARPTKSTPNIIPLHHETLLERNGTVLKYEYPIYEA